MDPLPAKMVCDMLGCPVVVSMGMRRKRLLLPSHTSTPRLLADRHAGALHAHAQRPRPAGCPFQASAAGAGGYRKRAAVPTPSSSPQTPRPPPLAPANFIVRTGSLHPAMHTTAAKITHRTAM